MAGCTLTQSICSYVGTIGVSHPTPPSCDPATALWYDVSANFRHARGYDRAGTVYIAVASNPLPRLWEEKATPLSCIWARGRYLDGRDIDGIGVFYGDGTSCHYAETTDEGRTFGSVTTIGSGTTGDFDVVQGVNYYYRRKSDGTLAVVLEDAFGNTIKADADTNLTCDDAPIAVRVVQVSGLLTVGIQYRSGGSLVHATSTDLVTFS